MQTIITISTFSNKQTGKITCFRLENILQQDNHEDKPFIVRTYVQSIKRKRITPIYFSANHYTKMNLVPIVMDYCLLRNRTLRNRKVHLSNCMEKKFHNISNISLRVIRCKNCSKCEFLKTISGVNEINIFFIYTANI